MSCCFYSVVILSPFWNRCVWPSPSIISRLKTIWICKRRPSRNHLIDSPEPLHVIAELWATRKVTIGVISFNFLYDDSSRDLVNIFICSQQKCPISYRGETAKSFQPRNRLRSNYYRNKSWDIWKLESTLIIWNVGERKALKNLPIRRAFLAHSPDSRAA